MTEKINRPVLILNYAFVALIFVLNFLGLPVIKWIYPLAALAAILTLALFNLKHTLPLLLVWCFIEGQSRIVWSYHPAFRLLFDVLVGVAILRTLFVRRRVDAHKLLPLPLMGLLLLHLLWYAVEFFNPNSVSMLSPIAATKIYVFPFLMFWMFRMNPEAFDREGMRQLSIVALTLMTLEALLALYQLQMGDSLLLGISPYYLNAMKTDVFTDANFRPFGTMFAPGVVGVYLFLATGFFFVREKFTPRALLLLLFVLVLVGVTILGSQVRSALVKFSLLIVSGAGAVILTSAVTTSKKLFFTCLTGLIALGTITAAYQIAVRSTNFNLEKGLERWETIDNFEALKGRRAGATMALVIAELRLREFPLGLGAGVTGAASSVSREALESDPIYNRETYWGYDNLFLSLIVEFGYGAIFYALLVLGIPLLMLKRTIQLFRRKDRFSARLSFIALTQVLVILLGNWVAIGLPYNPESFFFWLWAAAGLNVSMSDVST